VDPSAAEITVEPIESLEDVQAEWTRLADLSGHPFASWEWNSCWWRRFGGGRQLHSFICRDAEGEAVAILPLYVASTRPFKVARFLGYADLHSPVCAPEHRGVAAQALLGLIEDRKGCRIVAAEKLPGDQGWGELLGGRLIATHPDPVLNFEGRSWDEFLASKSRNFRQQARRRERRLVEEHGLRFRLADDRERLPADLETLFELHGKRWDEESTGVFEGERRAFHSDFAIEALRRGWLRLWIAEIDGAPVAAWYGWRFAGSEWYYQAGREQRFDDLSLGFVLLAHTVREACEEGVDSYRFLAGGEQYKWRFADADLSAETRLLASGLTGRAASRGVALGASLPAPLKRRVMRVVS
jgi:CelD/BcsL family acetyltransferase involved in cellulose biosynthesis